MKIEESINRELAARDLLLLGDEQVRCLYDEAQLEDAAGMLADLRDRCGIRLPLPTGTPLSGPFESEEDAREGAVMRLSAFPVVAIDRMATDDSRSTGTGDEYYVTGYEGANAAVALAEHLNWTALWMRGIERTVDEGNSEQ